MWLVSMLAALARYARECALRLAFMASAVGARACLFLFWLHLPFPPPPAPLSPKNAPTIHIGPLLSVHALPSKVQRGGSRAVRERGAPPRGCLRLPVCMNINHSVRGRRGRTIARPHCPRMLVGCSLGVKGAGAGAARLRVPTARECSLGAR